MTVYCSLAIVEQATHFGREAGFTLQSFPF